MTSNGGGWISVRRLTPGQRRWLAMNEAEQRAAWPEDGGPEPAPIPEVTWADESGAIYPDTPEMAQLLRRYPYSSDDIRALLRCTANPHEIKAVLDFAQGLMVPTLGLSMTSSLSSLYNVMRSLGALHRQRP